MNTAKYLGKRLREDTIGKAYGLASGKMNTWNLPEFATARQNMIGERDVGLSDYVNKMTRSGVEGPAAALGLERYNQGYGNSLLDYANKLQGAYTDKGLTLGKQARDEDYQKWLDTMNIGLKWQQGHDARQAQPNDLMKTIGAVKGVTSAIGDMADLGFGGAAMLGKLPGMEGSIMANKGINITQIMDILRSMGINIPIS